MDTDKKHPQIPLMVADLFRKKQSAEIGAICGRKSVFHLCLSVAK
jgi:hypothetical protein